MRWFTRWYGASPLHLLAMLGCFALAGYAAAELLPDNARRHPRLVRRRGHRPRPAPDAAVHARRQVRHGGLQAPPAEAARRAVDQLPARPRGAFRPAAADLVPADLPAALPFPAPRRPCRLTRTSWHWLAVTGALFLLSATALALRLGAVRRGTRKGPTSGGEVAAPASDVTPGHPVPPGPARHHGPAGEGKTSPGRDAHVLKGVAPRRSATRRHLAAGAQE